jgi:hypothetical protein
LRAASLAEEPAFIRPADGIDTRTRDQKLVMLDGNERSGCEPDD